uniref:Uncharacterized protein n=1 Tax=Romanomermis culicivorax TaxID=13658 RepID=A0A915ITT1_ROMCU
MTNEISYDLVQICVTLMGPYSMPIIAVMFSSNLKSSLRSPLRWFVSSSAGTTVSSLVPNNDQTNRS